MSSWYVLQQVNKLLSMLTFDDDLLVVSVSDPLVKCGCWSADCDVSRYFLKVLCETLGIFNRGSLGLV